MTSWHDAPEQDRRALPREVASFVVVAVSVPVLFFGLDALCLWIAGLVA